MAEKSANKRISGTGDKSNSRSTARHTGKRSGNRKKKSSDDTMKLLLVLIIAGIAIAIGAVVGIYFRRAKKKINEKLGVDENKNKEVESDDIIVK